MRVAELVAVAGVVAVPALVAELVVLAVAGAVVAVVADLVVAELVVLAVVYPCSGWGVACTTLPLWHHRSGSGDRGARRPRRRWRWHHRPGLDRDVGQELQEFGRLAERAAATSTSSPALARPWSSRRPCSRSWRSTAPPERAGRGGCELDVADDLDRSGLGGHEERALVAQGGGDNLETSVCHATGRAYTRGGCAELVVAVVAVVVREAAVPSSPRWRCDAGARVGRRAPSSSWSLGQR